MDVHRSASSGAKITTPGCEFGEQVLAKIVRRRGKHRLRNQMEAQFFQGTWVGIHMRTNEHIVVRASDGKALRARTVRCNKQGEQWSKEAVMNIKATPMNPDPANPRYETPEAAGKLEIDTDNKTGDQLPPTPHYVNPTPGPKEFKITKTIFREFGPTHNCIGCRAKTRGQMAQAHSDECRKKVQ